MLNVLKTISILKINDSGNDNISLEPFFLNQNYNKNLNKKPTITQVYFCFNTVCGAQSFETLHLGELTL